MNLNYKNIMRNNWGLIILGLFLSLWGVLTIFEFVFGLSLRTIPRNVFTWLSVGAIIAFFVWLNIRTKRIAHHNKPTWIKIVMRFVLPISIILSLIIIIVTTMVSLLSYTPEHVIEKHGYTMVARVHSFLDEYVYYYLYKGPIFYGQNMGYEYYCCGDNDPLSQTPVPEPKRWSFYDLNGNVIENGTPKENKASAETEPLLEINELEIAVIENREGELVFDISTDDFINSYNTLYRAAYKTDYLSSSSNWSVFNDVTPYLEIDSIRHRFSEDEQIWSMPTISIYTPENSDYIYEIELTFDDHGYQESLYKKFEEICFYSLQVVLPELSKAELDSLYKELYFQANDNFWGEYYTYSGAERPALNMIYYCNGIGLYGYYGAGTANICVIPMTQETLIQFEQEGIEIREIII